MVKAVRIHLTFTNHGKSKVRGINRTVRNTLARDVENLADETQRVARRKAPRDTGRLQSFIKTKEVPTSDKNIAYWTVVSENPVKGSAGYRRGGDDGKFDLAYWAAKSDKALYHFHKKNSARYMKYAQDWADKNAQDYVRKRRFTRKLNKYR